MRRSSEEAGIEKAKGQDRGLVAASDTGGNLARSASAPLNVSDNFGCIFALNMLHSRAILERTMDLSIKGVPEDQVRRLRERAKANHRSLQGELRALIDERRAGLPLTKSSRE